MNTAQLAWAAGLFEGEGCINIYFDKRRPNHKGTVTLSVSSIDEDVIDRFHEILGGNLYINDKQCQQSGKRMYKWQVASRAEAERVLLLLEPFLLSRRKEKLEQALSILKR